MAERALGLSARATAAGMATATTDYYPVVAGAIAGLRQGSPRARRKVYKHATRLLLRKLRSARPKLPRTQIRLEQRALEDAIRRVEAEAKAAETRKPPEPMVGDAGVHRRRRTSHLREVLVPIGLALLAACVLSAYWF